MKQCLIYFSFEKRWRVEEITEDDAVNSPYHYTRGRTEAIDVIEDAIVEAPSPMAGFLQAQVLKYILRLWHQRLMLKKMLKKPNGISKD